MKRLHEQGRAGGGSGANSQQFNSEFLECCFKEFFLHFVKLFLFFFGFCSIIWLFFDRLFCSEHPLVITINSYLDNMDTTDMVPPPNRSGSFQMNVATSSAAQMNSPFSSGKLFHFFSPFVYQRVCVSNYSVFCLRPEKFSRLGKTMSYGSDVFVLVNQNALSGSQLGTAIVKSELMDTMPNGAMPPRSADDSAGRTCEKSISFFSFLFSLRGIS